MTNCGQGFERGRLLTVEFATKINSKRLVPAERNVRRPDRSATATSSPIAIPCKTLYRCTSVRQSYIQSAEERAASDSGGSRGQSGHAPNPAMIPIQLLSNCLTTKTQKKTQLEKCIHCGQLVLRKISKIGAPRCQILSQKCTKFDFRWGSALDPARVAYSAPQNPNCI